MAKKVVAPIWSEDGKTLTNALVNDKLKTYNVVTEWYDGTPMNSTKVDDDLVYISYEGKFLKENFIKEQDTFLEKDTVQQLRSLSSKEILLLKMGVYKGVTLNGYYDKGDAPAPINYYLSDTEEEDDGVTVIEVVGIKLKANFKGDNNPITEQINNKRVMSGDSANRPSLTGIPIGYMFFDTTLGVPIFKKSTSQWVDATGTVV